MLPETEELLTVKQVGDLLHLNERTIRNHINSARLPARKLPSGKGWLIRREDLFAILRTSTNLHQSSTVRPGVAEAGTNPLQSDPAKGILRRTHTPEGRARALAALDRLLDGDADEQRLAWEHLQRAAPKSGLQFRRWNIETGERLDDQK